MAKKKIIKKITKITDFAKREPNATQNKQRKMVKRY